MAKFTATIIADHGGNYEAETYASNRFQAEENFARQHDGQVAFVREVEEESTQRSSSSWMNSGTDIGGMLGLCAILFVLWVIIEFWMWVIPIALIGAIGCYLSKKGKI